jgi:hypothetical protein
MGGHVEFIVLSFQAIYVEGFFLTHSFEVSLELAKFAKIHRKEFAQDIFPNKKKYRLATWGMASSFVMTFFIYFLYLNQKGMLIFCLSFVYSL